MTNQCFPSVRGRVMRLTKVDSCGRPVAGPCSTIVTEGFVSITYTANIKDGTTIERTKANGKSCLKDPGCKSLNWYDMSIAFCDINPSALAMTSGQELVTDWAGNDVGIGIGEEVDCDGGFALEVWTDIPGVVCDTTGEQQFGYFIVPWISGGIIGDWTIQEDALDMTITGTSKSGGGWGTGPYDVAPQDAANTAGPMLTPIPSKEHVRFFRTTIEPPVEDCDCKALVLPARYTTDADADGIVAALDTDDADVNDPGVAPLTAPDVTLTSPAAGTVSATFPVHPTQTVDSYAAYVDGVLFQTYPSPVAQPVVLTGIAAGTYEVYVIATNAQGSLQGATGSITVT